MAFSLSLGSRGEDESFKVERGRTTVGLDVCLNLFLRFLLVLHVHESVGIERRGARVCGALKCSC